MGEKTDQPKNDTEKKTEGGGNKNDAPSPVVLKLDMHCEGCVKKIKRAVRHFDGVEDVKADISSNKLTVFGKVDPASVRDRLAEKTNKKVELLSPQPKKDFPAADNKPPPEKKSDDKKPEAKKPEEKKPKESTVALKIRLHCDGCIQKIRKIILKVKGVESVNIEEGKDLVTVTGTMDVKEMVPFLNEKLKRNVEVMGPPKKEEDKKNKEGGGEKKGKKEGGGGGGGGGDGGKKAVVEEGGTKAVEINRMEHSGYGYPPAPMYWYDGYGPGQTSTSYAVEVNPSSSGAGYPNNQGYPYDYWGYGGSHDVNHHNNQGYTEPPPYYMHPRYPAPQMFSDENPNACSLM
ncbi:hypothetical protein HN51_040354 [Arachis hypogaea]|uniref:heavy metal-associated isoprenylated plant protein 6 n=1 Tax=Arachis ipaensis TaxID=130454 RepID=UPI0007AF62D2|nr:heavy metal-associated isoprenylated plant protein 6 [Arachis ipaensis]XP_025657515.1 heavy metal-associated isoprenylated plant protein 6 [Arachis hypogaea]